MSINKSLTRRKRIWKHLIQTRPHTPIVAWIAISGWGGLAAGGVLPEHSAHHALPEWLVLTWSVAIALGATAAVFGDFARQTRVESGGLAFLAVGALLFGTVTPFTDRPEAVPVIIVCAAIALMSLLRMSILGRARKAEKVAFRISKDERRRRQK